MPLLITAYTDFERKPSRYLHYFWHVSLQLLISFMTICHALSLSHFSNRTVLVMLTEGDGMKQLLPIIVLSFCINFSALPRDMLKQGLPQEIWGEQRENAYIFISGNFRPCKLKKNGKLILKSTAYRVALDRDGTVTKKQQPNSFSQLIIAVGMLYAAKKISDIIGLTWAAKKIINNKKS